MQSADQLVHIIVNRSEVPSCKRRLEIRRELAAHIEDFIADARRAGYHDDEIDKLFLARFGDPEQIARDFSRVYRSERCTLLALAYSLSTVTLATCLLLFILVVQSALAFGFGSSVVEILASRHTVIQALDITAFAAVYLALHTVEARFKTHRFSRAALFVVATIAVFIAACVAVGLPTTFLLYGLITAIVYRAVRLFLPAKAALLLLPTFAFCGVALAQLRSPLSPADLFATASSWLALAAAYLVAVNLVPRLEAGLLHQLERI